MSDVALFKGGLPAYLRNMEDETTSALAGGELGGRRISIKGGVFREMIGSKEYRVSEDRAINVVIIKAAPNPYRMYFEGTYVEGQNASPTCWSSNNLTPAADVPQDRRQASKCMDCPQNIKGSGQGESRACRYQHRIAVQLDGEIDRREVYQVILPAQSVFGDGEKGKLPLQAYARYLKAHNTPIGGIVTEMRFDMASPTPKLVFKPVRPLTEEEFSVVQETRESQEATTAVGLSVTLKPQEDAPKAAPPKAAPPKALAKPAPAPAVEPEPEVQEPKKAVAKKTAPTASLESLVENWDDE